MNQSPPGLAALGMSLMSRDNLSNELAGKLRTQILRGKWPIGSALPSTRELAREHNVSPNTIHGVLRELAAQGLVDLRPRRGRFVRANAPAPAVEPLRAVQVLVVRAGQRQPDKVELTRWTSNIIAAMEDVFATEGLRVTLLAYPAESSRWPEWVIQQIDERRSEFAGLVCFATSRMEKVAAAAAARNLPCVTINPLDEQRWDNYVAADNTGAGRIAGELFAELGFDRIVYLGSRTPIPGSSFQKLTGLVQSYLARGLPISGIQVAECASGEVDEAAGYEAMCSLLRQGNAPPQGLFCAGDLLAIGAMRACREAGLAIPNDISVIGSTGTELGAYTQPALTTIAQPMSEMGRRAGVLLLRLLNDKVSQTPGERLSCRLILRDSLRPVPEGVCSQFLD